MFVPQRDPSRLPLCATCKDIYDAYRAFNEGLPSNLASRRGLASPRNPQP